MKCTAGYIQETGKFYDRNTGEEMFPGWIGTYSYVAQDGKSPVFVTWLDLSTGERHHACVCANNGKTLVRLDHISDYARGIFEVAQQ